MEYYPELTCLQCKQEFQKDCIEDGEGKCPCFDCHVWGSPVDQMEIHRDQLADAITNKD